MDKTEIKYQLNLSLAEQYKYLKVRWLRTKVGGTIKRANNVCFQQTFFALS